MAKKLTFSFAIIFALFAVGCSSQPSSVPATQEVTIDGQAFTLELALDGASRTKGLSGRDVIADDGGMLFVFPDRHVKVQRFVMRDCPNPIDILFLDPAGRVVAMYTMQPQPGATEAELKGYSSQWPAQFVIEIKGGTLKKLSVAKGDKITLPLDELKRLAR